MVANDKVQPEEKRRKIDHFCEDFTDPEVDNQRIREVRAIMSPQLLIQELPLSRKCKETVLKAREEAAKIVQGKDDRLLVIVGPCTTHDEEATLEFAGRIAAERERFKDDLCIMQRVYFEKPSKSGWKGLIHDPALDESFMVNTGLRMCRKILHGVNSLGVPCAVQFLDCTTPQYLSDLASWSALERAEGQIYRELASGLSMPIGFENSTNGDVDVAIDACQASTKPQCFFSTSKQGTCSIVYSYGNKDCTVLLRGGKSGPNYDEQHVQSTLDKIGKSSGISRSLLIDLSGSNADHDHKKQSKVADAVCEQLKKGQRGICGVILKSNLFDGAQQLPVVAEPDFGHRKKAAEVGQGTGGDVGEQRRRGIRYGVSLTDACIDWVATVQVLETLAEAARARRQATKAS
eukprot:gnl/MRDRNA2_/MRDRNA2_65381_c0_seq2.p1 gnl/MRDRNA2_/MRDRNA2_65381_c0~~gnl/MRDRNA2_/MRDRNA2_65381_c0_seq2.p1  ORF type:complete len:405 (-),score=73.05 gnl/MRDRNA2_/MRDRNA2_65381_c0_seq2:2-1216(-)